MTICTFSKANIKYEKYAILLRNRPDFYLISSMVGLTALKITHIKEFEIIFICAVVHEYSVVSDSLRLHGL